MGCTVGKNQVAITDSPIDTAGSRGGSAVSKASRRSGDSGFDDDPFITEQKMKQREILSRPVLSAQGRSKPRETEDELLAKLRQEGIISKPITKRAGVSFEVFTVEMGGPNRPRPPPRLGRIEERRKRRRNRVLTEERLKKKLQKVELKKKAHEQARLARLQNLSSTKADDSAADALPFDTAAPQAASHDPELLAEIIKSKEEIATENRERKLRERLEKIQERKRHAEEVRRRRKEVVAEKGEEEPPSRALRGMTRTPDDLSRSRDDIVLDRSNHNKRQNKYDDYY